MVKILSRKIYKSFLQRDIEIGGKLNIFQSREFQLNLIDLITTRVTNQ